MGTVRPCIVDNLGTVRAVAATGAIGQRCRLPLNPIRPFKKLGDDVVQELDLFNHIPDVLVVGSDSRFHLS
jgi:hypothetical protein